MRARAAELDRRLWMDGLIAALGTGALGAALLFEFVADRATGTTVEVATTLAYPFGDVAPDLADRRHHRPHPLAAGPDLALLLAGLAVMAVADVAFTLQSYEATLPGGDWVEPIYLLSAVLLGAEAWQPRSRPHPPRRPLRRLAGNDRAGDRRRGDDRPRRPSSTSHTPAP